MIPGVLAYQIEQGLEEFLKTTFPPADSAFSDFMSDLFKERRFFQGPFISLSLPFRTAENSGSHLSDIAVPFHPYKHQDSAFQRLRRESAESTLIATGTGSGKTECFLYPILDYVYANRGKPGIKAVVIYPMNALAMDQARRCGRIIHESDRLNGNVVAGLLIGGTQGKTFKAKIYWICV